MFSTSRLRIRWQSNCASLLQINTFEEGMLCFCFFANICQLIPANELNLLDVHGWMHKNECTLCDFHVKCSLGGTEVCGMWKTLLPSTAQGSAWSSPSLYTLELRGDFLLVKPFTFKRYIIIGLHCFCLRYLVVKAMFFFFCCNNTFINLFTHHCASVARQLLCHRWSAYDRFHAVFFLRFSTLTRCWMPRCIQCFSSDWICLVFLPSFSFRDFGLSFLHVAANAGFTQTSHFT